MKRKADQGDGLSLVSKIELSKLVLREAFATFRRPAILFHADKNSVVTTHLARAVHELPPLLFPDHGRHLEGAGDLLRELTEQTPQLVVLKARNDGALRAMDDRGVLKVAELDAANAREARKFGFEGESFTNASRVPIADHLLRDLPVKQAVEKYRFDSLITGVTLGSLPDSEPPFFIDPSGDYGVAAVRPLLAYGEKDLWDYTFKFALPVSAAYRLGYSVVDDRFGRGAEKAERPPWEEYGDTQQTGSRLSEEDEAIVSERLKRLGYV